VTRRGRILAPLLGAVCLMAAVPAARAGAAPPDSLSLATATRLRRAALAIGDTVRAPYTHAWPDTLWRRVLALPSPWQWEALSHLATRRLAAGDAAGADSLLAGVAQTGWPIEDRAARLALVARTRAALGDTNSALTSARAALRAFPSAPSARVALAVFDTLMAARRDSATAADLAMAAEVCFWIPDRPAAIARLERAFASRAATDRWRLGVRLAEMQRLAKRLVPAAGTLDHALKLAPDSSARARVWLERARVQRDGGTFERAYLSYARAAALAPRTVTAEAAEWELGREAEEQGDPRRAERAYARTEALGLKRAADARLRRGLLLMNLGHVRRARACFAGVAGEAARFWWAVAAAESSAAARMAALDSLARTPGYTFYRVAARDSLSRSGWPAGMGAAAPATTGSPLLSLAASLIATGGSVDAAALLDRWAADDARALAPPDGVARHPRQLLLASALEARAGKPRESVRLAQRACEALADSAAPLAWSGWPRVYPLPASSPGDSALAAVSAGIEPALLRALIWKESHFDSSAISRTGAIGLTQLMPETARALARRLGDAPPTDSALAQPLVNVRYGAAYLAGLLRQFDGRVTPALAAYNAGVRAATRWDAAGHLWGEAMQCESIAYPETQDYVKGILAARAAYRELGSLRAGAR
jgi:soluble lytic murein transglycosylase-like protein/Tfp pilus assembly protein PilF